MNRHKFSLILLVLTLAFIYWLPRYTTPVTAQSSSAWEPQIAIVWPHDGQGNATSVTDARMVNVSVWPRNQVSCLDRPTNVGLYMTRNNAPAVLQESGELVLRTVNGVRFPSLEFNDIPVETADDSSIQHRFYADIADELSNVWVHAADARTIQPLSVQPDGYTTSGDANRAWIQIVYPHNAQGAFAPVERATFVNLATDLFQLNRLGQRLSARPDDTANLNLLVAQGNQSLSRSSISPVKSTYTFGNNSYPRWDFNDIPVQPGQQFHFMIGNTGSGGSSSIWTHAEDARTIIPQPDAPAPCLGPTGEPTAVPSSTPAAPSTAVPSSTPSAPSTAVPSSTATTAPSLPATATPEPYPYPYP
ncbi:MAG: hypothetical protein ACPGWR_26815 [Ardenticatenaceae bacterium]